MKFRSRALIGSAIVAVTAMVMAACGSSTGGAADTGGASGAAAPAASASAPSDAGAATDSAAPAASAAGGSSSAAAPAGSYTLQIGQISKSVAFFPIFIARDKGYFAEQGLTVNDPTILGTGAKLAAALVSESIEVGGGVMTDAFNAANAGQDVKVISNLVGQYYVDIIVGNKAKVAPDDAPLADKIKSLKGLRIGITGPGSGNEALVKYLFAMVGMNTATDVTLVNLGAQATAVVGALKNNQVDALSFFQPIGQQVEASKLGRIYISPARGDVPEIEGEAHGVAIASPKALADKQDALKAYIKGIAKAEEFIHTADAADVEAELAKYQGNMDPATVKALVPSMQAEIPETPEVTEKGYGIAVDFHEKAGMVKSAPAYDKLVDTTLIAAALGK